MVYQLEMQLSILQKHLTKKSKNPRYTVREPKHIISDQASVFVGDAFAELLRQWNIKPRLGTVGKHGSIAVTERVVKTLKCEWLRRVPLIKRFDHLTFLCTEFACWYNAWRPHMTLEGLRPEPQNRKGHKLLQGSKSI